MICEPCAALAGADQARRADGDRALGHPPEICRDHKIQPAGCACRHRPAGSATTKETARA